MGVVTIAAVLGSAAAGQIGDMVAGDVAVDEQDAALGDGHAAEEEVDVVGHLAWTCGRPGYFLAHLV